MLLNDDRKWFFYLFYPVWCKIGHRPFTCTIFPYFKGVKVPVVKYRHEIFFAAWDIDSTKRKFQSSPFYWYGLFKLMQR